MAMQESSQAGVLAKMLVPTGYSQHIRCVRVVAVRCCDGGVGTNGAWSRTLKWAATLLVPNIVRRGSC